MIQQVFSRAHPLRQRFRRVTLHDRNTALGEDAPFVHTIAYEVHRTSRIRPAIREGAGVGIEAWIQGQQTGMDVDHPPQPTPNHPGRQHPHIAGQRDDADTMQAQRRVDRLLMRLAAVAKRYVFNGLDGQALGGSHDQTARRRFVRQDQSDLEPRLRPATGVDQCRHV